MLYRVHVAVVHRAVLRSDTHVCIVPVIHALVGLAPLRSVVVGRSIVGVTTLVVVVSTFAVFRCGPCQRSCKRGRWNSRGGVSWLYFSSLFRTTELLPGVCSLHTCSASFRL